MLICQKKTVLKLFPFVDYLDLVTVMQSQESTVCSGTGLSHQGGGMPVSESGKLWRNHS